MIIWKNDFWNHWTPIPYLIERELEKVFQLISHQGSSPARRELVVKAYVVSNFSQTIEHRHSIILNCSNFHE